MENTSLFPLICLKFNVICRELLHSKQLYVDPSEAVLLFGDNSLTNESNEVIFRAVHKYIYN